MPKTALTSERTNVASANATTLTLVASANATATTLTAPRISPLDADPTTSLRSTARAEDLASAAFASAKADKILTRCAINHTYKSTNKFSQSFFTTYLTSIHSIVLNLSKVLSRFHAIL
jgi:hypothetical protein